MVIVSRSCRRVCRGDLGCTGSLLRRKYQSQYLLRGDYLHFNGVGWLTITCDPRLCGRGGLGPRVSDFHLQSHHNSVSITLGIIIIADLTIKTIFIEIQKIVSTDCLQPSKNCRELCWIQFCVLREFGGTLSHLWILLRLSGPGWYYGEYHYQGRASSRNGRYSDKMNTPRQWFQYLGLSASQAAWTKLGGYILEM